MSIKLDLTKFKHVKSDDKSTTLRHADGHELTVAHSPLSPANKEQLKALGKSAKDSAKAIDKGEAKQDAQVMPDNNKKQNGNATVHVDSTQKGMEQSKTIHKDQGAEHGTTIVKHDKDEAKNNKLGKVTVKGEQQLAEGGAVESEDQILAKAQAIVAKRQQQAKVTTGAQPVKNPVKMADGGDVPESLAPSEPQAPPFQAMPEETRALKGPEIDPSQARTQELYNQMVQRFTPQGERPITAGQNQELLFDPKTGKQPEVFDPINYTRAEQAKSMEDEQNAANIKAAQDKAVQENAVRARAGLPPVMVPNIPDGPQIPGSEMNPAQEKPNELPKQVTAPSEVKTGLPDLNNIEGMMQSGFQNKLAGIGQEAQAKSQMGMEQADALSKAAAAQQEAKIAYKSQYDSLEKERQAHMADIKAAHIDPNKYWTGDKDGNGSHSKIAAGIGMILAGFNPTSAPNAAINFLKYQMDQNLEAQKQNLGSEQNLLQANLRQFGNLKDATDMTRIMQHDIMQDELMKAAAKAQTPMAKAAALQAAGQLKMEAAPIFQNFAMRRAMMGLANNGASGNPSDTAAAEQMIAYARMTNPEMAKEMESRLLPGVGMAKVPVPEGVRKEIIEKQGLATAAQDLLSYSKKHSNITPLSDPAGYAFGVTKALAFQQKVREGLLGTVFRESEKPLLEKFVSDNPAGAFKAFTTQPQLKAIIESNMMGLNAVKSSYGLPTQQSPQSSEPIKGKDGRMYQKVPGGYMPLTQTKGK